MFIGLMSGLMLGALVKKGRLAYLLCLPVSIFLATLVTPFGNADSLGANITRLVIAWVVHTAAAMLSVMLVRWRLGRVE